MSSVVNIAYELKQEKILTFSLLLNASFHFIVFDKTRKFDVFAGWYTYETSLLTCFFLKGVYRNAVKNETHA